MMKKLLVISAALVSFNALAVNNGDPNLAPKAKTECSKRSGVARNDASNQKLAKNDLKTKDGKAAK